MPDPTCAKPSTPSTRRAAARPTAQALFAIGDVAAPDGLRISPGRRRADPAAIAGGDRGAARPPLRRRRPTTSSSPPKASPPSRCRPPAWAARSGDPVLFAGRDKLPKATAGGAAAPTRRYRSTCSGPSSAISSDVVREDRQDRPPRAAGLRRGPGRKRDRPRPLRRRRLRLERQRPRPRLRRRPQRRTARRRRGAAPLSASGTWGPLLLTDDADTLPAALRGYLLDVKPGYTTDPTRAFYNHVWVIGDQEAIDVEQQAEIDSLAELAKIGGQKNERGREPRPARRAARGHRRGHPRPGRRLHPPLRAAGPQPDPAPDRAAPRRPPGAARRRAQDRRARGAGRAQRRPARHDGHRPIEEPRAGGLAAEGVPGAVDQRLPRRGRPDRRRPALGPAADLRRARGRARSRWWR